MIIQNINEKVLEYSNYIDPITGKMKEIYTPQLNTLSVKPSIIIPFEQIQYIKNMFLNSEYYRTHPIPQERYDTIALFLLSEKIPEESKKIVGSYLNEDEKKYVFEQFLKEFINRSPTIDKEKAGDIEIAYYTPRINGVPVGTFSFESIENILLGKTKLTNDTEFIYLKCFMDSNSYFQSDFCPMIVNYYRELLKGGIYQKAFKNYFEIADKEKINEILNYKKVEHDASVNPSLKEYILKSIPQEFDLLEKSIYVYAKLCQILEYDNIYYLNDNVEHQRDEYNIPNYDLENNKVVCYTFSYILSDLLREIGVESIKEKSLDNHRFKNSHAYIEYLIDEIAIMADSTHRGVEQGDLSQFKFSEELKEIRCSMFELTKQSKFKEAKSKVTKFFEHENTRKKEFFPTQDEISRMNDLEKIIAFNNYINNAPFYNINLLAYAQELKNRLDCNISLNYYTGKNPSEDIIINVRINPFSIERKEYKEFDIEYGLDANSKVIVTSNLYDDEKSM